MNFIKVFLRKAKNGIRFYYLCIKDILVRAYYGEPKIAGLYETVDKIVKDRCSVARYGDGEYNIVFGNKIDFQNTNNVLAEKMANILKTEDEKFLVCLNDDFHANKKIVPKSNNFWKSFMRENRAKIMKLLVPGKTYYNAGISRFYNKYIDKSWCEDYVLHLKKIWENRKLVIIEGEKSRLGVGNDLFDGASEIKRILCPAENAFAVYNETIEYADKNVDRDALILIALGPTATAMAYDLYKVGFQAIDIGHVDIEYEWMKMGVTEKVTVKGKYTNETNDGKQVCEIHSEKYDNEIMARIGC